MEAKLGSRKRKQPTTNPFVGVFTRSKSQIYLHQNRSGRARSDAIRRRHHSQLLSPTSKSHQSQSSDSPLPDDSTRSSVKDLRTRRVFSPASIIDEYGGREKIQLKVDLKGGNWNDRNPNLSPTVEGDLGVNNSNEKKGVGFSVMDSSNPNFEITGNSSGDVEAPSAGNFSDLDGSAAKLKDECGQITPVELKADLNGVKDGIYGKDDSIRKAQMDLNLPSRRKVYKTPSSFSYRRLLPYLMDTQDDSCVSHIEIVDLSGPCDDQSLVGLVPKISADRDICVVGKNQEAGQQFGDRKPVVENGTSHSTDALKSQNDSHVNSNVVLAQDCMRMPNVAERCENPEASNLIEEFEQMTPPDADVFGKADDDDCIAHQGEKIMLNVSPSNITRKSAGVVENLGEQTNSSISKRRRVLKPCARMKLLRTPSSVSYRRLLPFLMDIAKDESCTLEIDQFPKDEKDFEQKPQPRVMDSSDHDTAAGKSEIESDSVKDRENEKPRTPTPLTLSTDGSSDETNHTLLVGRLNSTDSKSNNMEPSIAQFSNSTELHVPPVLQLEVKLQLEHLVSDSPRNTGKEPDPNNRSYDYEENSSSSLCSTADHENVLSACGIGISGNSLLDAKDDFVGLKTPIDEGNTTILDINQNLSSIERFDPSGIHVAGRRKGILKRNPPGCRGICDCLNCASFRLHAERAFEFSRNQMLSAEELAVELIEELTCLRSVLQKSAVDADHVIVLQGNQVKEVCRKALQTEELAKQRIAQMNEDLSIHCRRVALERPRVSFARKVKEKLIAKVGLPRK